MRFPQYISGVSLAVLLGLSTAANATSIISEVGGATVTKGKLTTQFRAGFTNDHDHGSSDDRLRMRQHVDYGVTDSYALRFVVFQDKRKGANIEHSAVRLENRFQFFNQSEHGFDGGVRLVYTHRDGDKTPHAAAFRLLAGGDLGSGYKWRNNVIFSHDVGQDMRHGVEVEVRSRITKDIEPFWDSMRKFEVGAELLNDFGKLRDTEGYSSQDHQIGFQAKTTFDNGIYTQVGYRVGVSDGAADHGIKFQLGRSF